MKNAFIILVALLFSLIITSCANRQKNQSQDEITYKKAIFVACEGEATKEYERKYADVTVSQEAESGWLFRQREAGKSKAQVKVKSEYKTLETYLTHADILYKKTDKDTADLYNMGVMVCYGISDKDIYTIDVKKTFNNYSEAILTLNGSKKKVLISNYGINFAKNPPPKPTGHTQTSPIQDNQDR